MHFVKSLCLAAALALFVPHSAYGAEITVSAAASLADAFTELKVRFEADHPGVTIRTNFASSNTLLRQILEGAPVSLFASADQTTMDKAEALIVPGTRKTFAANTLVLITPPDQTGITGLKDLPSAGRIAIGNPDSVPAGRYAREALTSAGLWEVLSPKFIPGNSVRQVLDYVARGEVDAGIVYATDAVAGMFGRVAVATGMSEGNAGTSVKQARAAKIKVRITAPLTGHTPVTYPLALIKPEVPEAHAFADFILNPEGQKILAKHGFSNGE